jgi:PilZ domain-containing protein
MPNTGDRKTPRHFMPCHLAPVFDGATDGALVHPPDLSTRGMFINTANQLTIGAPLQLTFRLALTEMEIAVEAVVRHVIEGQGVGVEFVNLSPQAERFIQREIQAADRNYASSRYLAKRSLLSDLPRRMWNNWIHGKEEARY